MQHRRETLDGATVDTRQAETDAERLQLRREATMLVLARHPAVAEVVSSDEDGGRLVTRVGARATLEDLPRPGTAAWLRALAGAAQTVADLHALGLVHGDLRADCIWVDERGQAVLDGFAHAGLAGEPVGDDPPRRPSMDVAALAAMVTTAIRTAERDAPPGDRAGGPGRPSRRRGRPPVPGPALAAVLAAGQAGTWPPARRLAHALDAELARLPAPADAGAGGGAGEGASATTGSGRATTPQPPRHDRRDPRPHDPTPADTNHRPGSAAEPDPDPYAHLRPADEPTPVRRSRRPRVAAVLLAVVGVMALGWGASRVAVHPSRPSLGAPRLSAAPVLSIAGTSYRIGQAGDQVEVGSWGCRPTRAVVLRPHTGAVFAFDGWAHAGHDLVAHVVAHVDRGSRLAVVRRPSGCDGLAATTPSGTRVDLDGSVAR